MSAPDLGRLGDIPDPVAAGASADAALEERIRRAVLSAPAPSRAGMQKRRIVAAVVSLVWIGLLLVALGVRKDLSTLPALYLGVWLGAPFVLGVVAIAGALDPTKSGLGLPARVSGFFAVLGPVTLAIAALALEPPALVQETGSFVRAATTCLVLTLAGSVAPLGLAAFALRHAFPAAARWRSALVGAATGLFAGGALNLHCSFVSPLHMLLGHALPVAFAALLGAIVGGRFMRS